MENLYFKKFRETDKRIGLRFTFFLWGRAANTTRLPFTQYQKIITATSTWKAFVLFHKDPDGNTCYTKC
jgi:hypothetical protein